MRIFLASVATFLIYFAIVHFSKNLFDIDPSWDEQLVIGGASIIGWVIGDMIEGKR